MPAFPFLDLPVELAEHILLSTDIPTVLRVMQTAHLMHTFVCDSEEIQYKIQLYYHGYVDAPRTATSSYMDRRMHLDKLRHQWVITEPTQNGRLYLSSTFYVLEGGLFAMLGRSSNCFFITRNQGPSRGIGPLAWKTPSLDFKILTFGMDPTVNLLAVFGVTEIDKKHVMQIHLLTLTDCTPCPLAALPVFRFSGFPDHRYIQDAWSKILISGPWLGLTWREVLDSNWERLLIWNWKSGNICLYIERVLAFSFISNEYLLTVHQEHLSVYNLSKEYPRFNRLDPSTEPVPVYQLALPGICHAAGLHRSGSLDHIPGPPPIPPPPDATDALPIPSFIPEKVTSTSFEDGTAAWRGEEVSFYEDPSRNILAVNLIRYVGHWPRVASTMGMTIIIPLQRLVDFAEETVAKSAVDAIRIAAKHAEAQPEAQGKAAAQMHSELSRVQPLETPHHYPIFELARLERQRGVELTRAGRSATTVPGHGSVWAPRKPRCFQPARWLKHALVFNQETHGRPYDYRRSIVSGSRFVSSIEVREGKRLFQLIEFNPTWVNALERRLACPARDVRVHKVVKCGYPMFHPVEQNWETEGLIVPLIFGEGVAANDDSDGSDEGPTDSLPEIHFGSGIEEYNFPPLPPLATPGSTPIIPPPPNKSGAGLRPTEVDSSEHSWYGWRVARCGEVKYAWKVIQTSRDIIALDVAIQEGSLIYTAIEDYSSGAHVYFAISSF